MGPGGRRGAGGIGDTAGSPAGHPHTGQGKARLPRMAVVAARIGMDPARHIADRVVADFITRRRIRTAPSWYKRGAHPNP